MGVFEARLGGLVLGIIACVLFLSRSAAAQWDPARDALIRAEKTPEGPKRQQAFREAARAYRRKLEAAPARDEAPEAAINGAYAFMRVGECDRAIEMCTLFIAKYGDAQILSTLKNGDANHVPPLPPNPQKYAQRIRFLLMAHEHVATAELCSFDFGAAARTYDALSELQLFSAADRQNAAGNALRVYALLGDGDGMKNALARLKTLGASPSALANAEFTMASSGADASTPDSARRAMARYYFAHVRQPDATGFVIEAAYRVATSASQKNARDAKLWWQRALDAYVAYRKNTIKAGRKPALDARATLRAAEAAYTLLDQRIAKNFDATHPKRAGDAKKWHDELQVVIDDFASPRWAAEAMTRQGTLFEALHDDSAVEAAVERYASAIVRARSPEAENPPLTTVLRRLALLNDEIGEQKLAEYCRRVQELDYQRGMFANGWPVTMPKHDPEVLPLPLPDASGLNRTRR